MEDTDTATHKSKTIKHVKMAQCLIWFIAGIFVALFVAIAVRFALAKDTSIHYHANFALYVDGQKDNFESFTFYEEVAACNDESVDNPKVRTHMHDSKAGLIHIHDGGVTWGQFFENIGYTVGNNVLETRKADYVTTPDGKQLSFILNGEEVSSVANKLINSEDRLLINFGTEGTDVLKQRFNEVPADAAEANKTQDPAACSGGHEFTVWSRLKQAIGVNEGH